MRAGELFAGAITDGSALRRSKSTATSRGDRADKSGLKQKHAVAVAEKAVLLPDRVGISG